MLGTIAHLVDGPMDGQMVYVEADHGVPRPFRCLMPRPFVVSEYEDPWELPTVSGEYLFRQEAGGWRGYWDGTETGPREEAARTVDVYDDDGEWSTDRILDGLVTARRIPLKLWDRYQAALRSVDEIEGEMLDCPGADTGERGAPTDGGFWA